MRRKLSTYEKEIIKNDPSRKWSGYYNPDDKRIFVPKQNPWLGYTLNFGNPYSYVVLIGIILLVIILSVFAS